MTKKTMVLSDDKDFLYSFMMFLDFITKGNFPDLKHMRFL